MFCNIIVSPYKYMMYMFCNSQALELWLDQLNGPLSTVLQNPTNQALRATGCDAISCIGPKVFSQLPVNNIYFQGK